MKIPEMKTRYQTQTQNFGTQNPNPQWKVFIQKGGQKYF